MLEQELKKIAAEITGTEDFGITDAFRDLGLTSISAIRLATRLFKRFGIQVNVRELASAGSIQSVENEILAGILNKSSDEPEDEPGRHEEPMQKNAV